MATKLDKQSGNHIVPGKEAQKRYRRRKKLKLEAAELTRKVQEQIGIRDPGLARKLLSNISMALRLPFRWDDDDMRKAENFLHGVRRELFDKKRKQKLTGLRESLYRVYQETEGETPEKLNEVKEFYTDVIKELVIVDPEKMENNETNFILLMTLGTKVSKMPDWFIDRLTEYTFNYLRPGEIESYGAKFSEKYNKYFEELERTMAILGVVDGIDDDDDDDEMKSGIKSR